jgi:hypothetical protein
MPSVETKKPRPKPGFLKKQKFDDLSVPTAKHQQGAANQTQTGQRERGRFGSGNDADISIVHVNACAIPI